MVSALLERIASGLAARGISYMVIGGQAVLLHGEARLTRDIDITLGVGPEGLSAILNLAQECGWQTEPEDPESFVERTMVLPCSDPVSGMRIDFIFSFSPYEQEAIAHAVPVRMGSADVRFASVEDLLIHKVVAGRPRDIEDARSVLLKHPAADRTYILRWLGELDAALDGDYTSRFRSIADSIG
jgi:predicted nucleotidyltransferase